MTYMHFRTVVALLAAVAAGCGPQAVSDLPSPVTSCLALKAPEQGITTSSPAKVSLFFTVDTCAGEPVPGLTADAFELSEDGARVSQLESQQTIQPRSQRYRMNSLLMLDMSGSILKSGQFPALREAAGRYATQVLGQGDGQRLAVMTFDGRERPSLVADFTADEPGVQHALDSLLMAECQTGAECAGFSDHRTCSGNRCVDDSTNLNGAVVAGIDALELRLKVDDGVQYKDAALVVFTDGSDQASRVTEASALARVHGSAVKVFTVGLGTEVDARALVAFGKDGDFPVAQADQLRAAFESVAARVTGAANRSYLLDYCSPRRSGKHTLRVAATVQTKAGPMTGAFSGEFDATGFSSGCSLQ